MKDKKLSSVVLIVYLLSCAAFGSFVLAEEQAATPAPAMDEAIMAQAKAYATPGENHKVLEVFVGKWEATVKSWMDSKSEPMVSQSQSNSEWILGGRFIQEKFSGTFMNEPYEGIGLFGYDNIQKEYQYFWLDNMGTGVAKITSQYDPASKTFTEEGSVSCPITNDKRAIRGKITLVDNDHFVQEFFMKDLKTGEEFRSMEISYSRVK